MVKELYEFVGKTEKKGKKNWKINYKICKILVNLLEFPIFFFHNDYGIDKDSKIIVSMTTIPARINIVWKTICTILNQNQKPKKIILWLSKEEFEKINIPKKLKKLEKRGLEIRYCDDIKPHKKYFYTMKEFEEDYIITIDDDILYPENLVQELWKASQQHPNTIICTWSHNITFDVKGNFLPYTNWKNIKFDEPKYSLMPVGCGGVMYPPHCLSKKVFDKENIKKLALYTDDLWLKTMELEKGTKAYNCNKYNIIYFNTFATKKNGLWNKNVLKINRNDVSWEKLNKEYPVIKEKLKEE